MAMTIDGHSMIPGGTFPLGSREDKRRMDKHRIWADFLIVSAKTVRAENPRLILRTRESLKQPKPIIIMKTFREFPLSLNIFSKKSVPGEIWYKETKEPLDSLQAFSEKTGFSTNKFHSIDEILLRKSSGKIKFLLEGGPFLNGLFLGEDLVDDIFITITPYLYGGLTTDRVVNTENNLPLRKFSLQSVERRKNEIFLRYRKNIVTPFV